MTPNHHTDIRIFSEKKEFLAKALQLIYDIQPRSIALSGGSSPIDLYKELSDDDLELNKINFFQVDERYVPKKDKNSNYCLIKRTLFKFHKPKKFYHFDTSKPIKEAVASYEEDLKAFVGKKKTTFDLTIIGMGSDGHIASLFPYCAALDEKDALAAHTKTSKFAVKDRLTLTYNPIIQSKNILLLINGIEKIKALEALTHSKKNFHGFPAKKLLTHKKFTIFYLIN